MSILKHLSSSKILGSFAVIFWLVLFLYFSQQPYGPRSFMYTDFIQYWSSYQCYEFGGNPYGFDCMKKVQAMAGYQGASPVMMWTPPISLFLGKILPTDFKSAGMFFLFFNWMLLGLISVMLYHMLNVNKSKKILMLFTLYSFYPIWSCLEHGQLAIIFLFSLVLMMYADKHDKKFLMALSIVPLSLKPHLFIFPVLYLIWRELRIKRSFVLMASAAAVLTSWAIAEFFFPGSLSLWLSAVTRSPDTESAVSIFEWVPATIPGVLRSLAARFNLQIANSISLVLPLGAAALYFWYLVKNGSLKPLYMAFPPILLASYLLAPYGWIFDQSILLISFLPILFRMPLRTAYITLFILNGGMHFLMKIRIFSSHEQLIVFAIMIGVLSVLSTKMWKTVDNSL